MVVQILHGCVDEGRTGAPEGVGVASRTDVARGSTSEEMPAWMGLEVEHWLPGPARGPRHTEARAELDRTCRGCHVAQAEEWAHSRHAQAWSNEAFTRAFAIEPLPFCQACHSAESPPDQPVSSSAAQMGVGCVTCHVDPDASGPAVVWTGPKDGRQTRAAPHPIERSAAFAGPQVCAACHEFEFPDRASRPAPLAMQATISEHRASAARTRACIDCHMPRVEDPGGGHRDHRFVGADDAQMLRRALRVTAERPSRTTVRLHLRPFDVGHAVPTGDLLRRLEVTMGELGPRGRLRVLDRRWLGRRFAMRPNGVRDEVADDRVGPGGATVELRIPAHLVGSSALGWRVMHQRVAHGFDDPLHAVVEGELEIASGVVPAADGDAP